MNLNVDPKWLMEMAEKENGGIISVGGLVTRIQAQEAEEKMLPRISLLHATRGRAKQALEAKKHWLQQAYDSSRIEHIFAIDADDRSSIHYMRHDRHLIVEEPRGCVKAWNAAAAQSQGDILIQMSDDWDAPRDWDWIIWDCIVEEAQRQGKTIKTAPIVLAVSDGQRKDDLLCMAILTRARYKQQGHLFAPEYFGVFSDNEFTVRAYRDGVVIDYRDILVFNHNHPAFDGIPIAKWDATHRRQNDRSRYIEGEKIFRERNP